jgi:hypothetical protein
MLVGALYGSTRLSLAAPAFPILWAACLVGGLAIFMAIQGSVPLQDHWGSWRKVASSFVLLPAVLVGAFYATLTVFGFVQLFVDVATWTFSLQREAIALASGVSAVIVMGISLFALRLMARFLFGVSEVFGAVVIAVYFAIDRPDDMNSLDLKVFIAIMSGAVFVFVRGLDNLHQALDKADTDPFLSSIRRLIHHRNSRK